jgi:hypothetical protein
VDGLRVNAVCEAGPTATVVLESYGGGFGTFWSDTKSMPHQAGTFADASPLTIASTTFADGGTYFVAGYSTDARALTGTFYAYIGSDGTCNFQSTVLVDSSTANISGPTSSGTSSGRPAISK